jgi:hypothetical protein
MLQASTPGSPALPELRVEARGYERERGVDVEARGYEREQNSERAWPARVAEFLFVGGLTPLLFPLAWLLRTTLGLDDAELAVGFTMFYAAYAVNDPHFAVTYVLFYKDFRARAAGDAFTQPQRVRYWIAGVLVPLSLGLWAVLSLWQRSALWLGLLFQLMFLSVGWHYTKQGFGLLSVLSARRGVHFNARERAVLLAHCYAGWAYAWASPADPGHEVEAKGVVYMTIAQPPGLERLTQIFFIASIVPLVWVLVQKRRREGSLPILTPLTAFFCSIWLWSIYSQVDPLVRYVIPALHSLQYLYMVWLLKRNEAREREGPPWFETSSAVRLSLLGASALGLGFVLFHGAPSLLDDARALRLGRVAALGPTPYFAALFAFVNIHHYFMDTVIWRRENPLTRYLRVTN